METKKTRIVKAVVLVLIGLISFFLLTGVFSSTSFPSNQNAIEYLGEKQTTVMELTAATTAASTVITLIPGDAGTPIAEKLADFSTYFLIVLCAILLEKYLVTIMGFAAFKILIPLGCVVLAGSYLFNDRGLKDIGKKFMVFGILISLIIPSSVGVSKMIETTYAESIQVSLDNAKDEEGEVEEITDETEDAEAVESEITEDASEESHWYDIFNPFVENVKDGISNVESAVKISAGDAVEKARSMMNRFMEALAVMLVTSCLIPILVIVFFLWLCKIILGADLGGSITALPIHIHDKCDRD